LLKCRVLEPTSHRVGTLVAACVGSPQLDWEFCLN
jgi:hypothetical protein